jgi:hypothetical protein
MVINVTTSCQESMTACRQLMGNHPIRQIELVNEKGAIGGALPQREAVRGAGTPGNNGDVEGFVPPLPWSMFRVRG